MALTIKQRGVLKGIIPGAAITLVVIAGAVLLWPMALSPEASSGERLAFAISTDAFIALWLGVSVGLLARHRFFTPEDIDGGGLSRLGNRERSAIDTSKHAGTVSSSGTNSSGVVDSNARSMDIGDTGRRSSIPVWPCVICAWLSRWRAISGARVCSYLLPVRCNGHSCGCYVRMESVPLKLAARRRLF